MSNSTAFETSLPKSEELVRLLHLALKRIAATPPREILSPATQPRRAAVAIIIHILPPTQYQLPAEADYEVPSTLDELFAMDWVKQPGCAAEMLYIRRKLHADANSNPASSENGQQHVAFPGGRMDLGDESEQYTAMRTTWEELGIDLAERDWLYVGRMDDREITTSLGKRLLMILSPFVFIRTTPVPFSPIPPQVKPDGPDAAQAALPTPPTIYSVPLSYLLSPNSKWSHVTIDISSRLAPSPYGGILARVFGVQQSSKRKRAGSEATGQDSSPLPEYSVEEAAALASDGFSFWLWVLRAGVKFFVKNLVGDMRFSALLLRGRVVHFGNEEPSSSRGYEPAIWAVNRESLKLWGLTLGMTLDLLSNMQPHLYQPRETPTNGFRAPSAKENVLDPSFSSVSLAGLSPSQSRTNSISEKDSFRNRRSGSGRFTSNGWVPSATSPPPAPVLPATPSEELVKQLEDLQDLEGASVWTPSMTCVFPKFSIPDVNFWIWVFGRRYRQVVRGWENSMRYGGSNDRRINWSGQALSSFYAAVRRALLLVIVARIVGIILGIGFAGWWLWRKLA